MCYVNYHRHSMYSNIILTDSVVSNEDYCKRAVELGHKVISSCEHGTPGNYRECYELAKKYGLHWRYVMEAYFVLDRDPEDVKDKTNCHIILAARTKKGVGDLNALMSEANLSGYYYKPRIDLSLLFSLDPRDVFVTTACIAGVWKYGEAEAERLVRALHDHFGESFMLEVQYHNCDKQKEVNRQILRLYRKYGIPLIAGMDSHYIYPEQKALRDARLEANRIVYEDEGEFYMDYPSDDEAFRRFQEQGVLSDSQIREALNNTGVFLTFEDIEFPTERKLPTIYPQLTQEERNEKYRQLIRDKWREYRVNVPRERWPEYEAGIAYEVETITGTNMSDYFLLDYELVRRAKELGGHLTFSGRGSAPSYFTNMLLGFTSIDRFRVPITMYPDRFISRDRLMSGSLPDIDMNCGEVEPFAKAQAEVIGEWHSAPMVAFGTLKRLSAWKMYCRSAAVPFEVANKLSDALKKYELDVKHTPEDEEEPDVLDYIPAEYHDLLHMSEQYLGMIDSISPHPCAYVVTNEDIRREYGVIRLASKAGAKKVVYAAFIDGQTCERFLGLKNDLLKVDVVKINDAIYRRIGMDQPPVPLLMEMISDDAPTWSLYAKGYTIGLNQCEREKSMEKVMRYKPRNLSELSAFVAAIRPAFQSMLQTFLSRQHFDYGIPAFDRLLQTRELPSSFILYQEQMMKTLQYAGFTAPESYAAIKAIAKKHPEKVLPMKERFLEGFKRRLMDDEKIEEKVAGETSITVWGIMSDACGYGFVASHALSVALDSLYTAWAKAHFPYETYVTLLEIYSAKGDKDKVAKIKTEMRKAFGITLSPPRFGQDNRGYFVDKDRHTISDSLTSVKYLSAKVASTMYHLGQNTYEYFVDLLYDMAMAPALDTRATEILIRLGFFEAFGSTGKLLDVWKAFSEGESRFSKSHVKATQEKRLDALRQIEKQTPERVLPVEEIVTFEIEHLGAPMTLFPDQSGLYAVIEVDTRYSPKVRLFNIATGTTGQMKITKAVFSDSPLETGCVIRMQSWRKRQAFQYTGGKSTPKPGVYDLWLDSYTVVTNSA